MLKASLAVFAVLLSSTLAQAAGGITVSGTGKVKYTPNIAYLGVGFSTDAKTAAEAWQKNADLVKKLFAQLKALGIDEKDLQTSNLGVSPRYFYPKDEPPQLLGYTASYDLTITVRKLDQIGRILDVAAECGANRSLSVRFDVENAEKLIDQAREAAVQEARKKAEMLTKGAGASLGLVQSISEGSNNHWRTYHLEMPAKGTTGDARPLPIAAGEQEISVTVTVTYSLAHTTR